MTKNKTGINSLGAEYLTELKAVCDFLKLQVSDVVLSASCYQVSGDCKIKYTSKTVDFCLPKIRQGENVRMFLAHSLSRFVYEEGFTKRAWVRDPGQPIGKPGTGRISCPCDHVTPASKFERGAPDVLCECGVKYSWDGWIKS